MKPIDKIIFGDNQFFGINHMSHDKAQQLAEHFFMIENVFKVYKLAFDAGIRAIMLNSNNRAKIICDYFRNNRSIFQDLNWYPSIPYPHKYAAISAEKGVLSAINEMLLNDNSASGILSLIAKGSTAVFTHDVIRSMQMLIDLEMRMFKGFNVRVVFLQNVITDLVLGYGIKEIFYEYCEYIRKKYKALPGLITQNMPCLKTKLQEWKIDEVVICTSFNKIGYLMSPNVESYIEAANSNDSSKYQLMAMSTLASGAIPAKEAYDFINKQKLQAVVFGSSSEKNIKETISLIDI